MKFPIHGCYFIIGLLTGVQLTLWLSPSSIQSPSVYVPADFSDTLMTSTITSTNDSNENEELDEKPFVPLPTDSFNNSGIVLNHFKAIEFHKARDSTMIDKLRYF